MNPRRVVVEVSSTVRRMPLSAARTRELVELTMASEKIRDAMISIAFVGKTAIAALNSNYLKHAGPTDVISFGMKRENQTGPVIGDIYICPEIAQRNAKRLKISVRQEIERLVVHGSLHVAGNEHPEDESRTSSPMWRKQEKILARAR
jgi:probable rRNA maturation factor